MRKFPDTFHIFNQLRLISTDDFSLKFLEMYSVLVKKKKKNGITFFYILISCEKPKCEVLRVFIFMFPNPAYLVSKIRQNKIILEKILSYQTKWCKEQVRLVLR